MTPVVVREMPLRELIDLMLGAMGKDLERIREALARGSFVSGASRIRWEGWAPEDTSALESLLGSFPDSESSRLFDSTRCSRVIFRAASLRVEVDREIAAQRRLLQRKSFWEALMEFAASRTPQYLSYSYRDRADRYRLPLLPSECAALMENARLLRYDALARQLRGLPAESIELDVQRD